MANPVPKKHTWITVWFIFSGIITIWDAFYIVLRPRSLEGGDLRWLWATYQRYEEVDKIYDPQDPSGYLGSIAVLSFIEVALEMVYVYGVHVSPFPSAPLYGFAGTVMILAKTIGYATQEYLCDWCTIGHNESVGEIVGYWLSPIVIWSFFCYLVIRRLGGDISESMRIAAVAAVSTKHNILVSGWIISGPFQRAARL
ncbi:hypothetical protein BDQ17DRAFT_220551 [Cyathus striatus]|nr:hypothetical protein BDQ17DRAFT_220551 [Cyathus striatus]